MSDARRVVEVLEEQDGAADGARDPVEGGSDLDQRVGLSGRVPFGVDGAGDVHTHVAQLVQGIEIGERVLGALLVA